MELAANDRLIVKNILVQQVGFLGDASERAKDNTELLTLTAEMLDALKMIVLFDGSQEKDRRAGLSEEDDYTKKPALTTDEGQRQLMEAKRIDGVGMVFLRMPITNCVDGSADGVSIYEPAMGLIHRINENELQFSREFELGRMRVVASADILRTHNGKKSLTDDVFVGLDGNEQSVGITPFAPALRNESYEARRQTYLKAIENLLGIKRGILSDAEAVSKTATEINSSAGDYSLSIMDFQHLYYDALQAALRLGDQIGQAYRLCDASAWDADELAVTWGNGVLYDADQEWTERKELVQMGLLKPELALAWKFDLPAESEADLAEIRKNYMPELKDLEG